MRPYAHTDKLGFVGVIINASPLTGEGPEGVTGEWFVPGVPPLSQPSADSSPTGGSQELLIPQHLDKPQFVGLLPSINTSLRRFSEGRCFNVRNHITVS